MRIVALDVRERSGRIGPRGEGNDRLGVGAARAANAHRTWDHRSSILVTMRIEGAPDRIDATWFGHGEASPLPGYSAESLDDARHALESFAATLPRDLPFDTKGQADDLLLGIANVLGEPNEVDVPSARCALETALLDAAGRAMNLPVWRLLRRNDAPPPGPVDLCGLITEVDTERVKDAAHALIARGIGTAKLKIGCTGAFGAELEAAATVRRAGLDVRLDANQALPIRDLAARLEAIRPIAPILVEEPAPPADVLDVAASSSLPRPLDVPLSLNSLALDETLQAPDAEAWMVRYANAGLLAAIVLKPMALGGPLRCLRLAERARTLGAGTIVSHLFDGPIAWSLAAHLAVALADSRTGMGVAAGLAAGLDRHAGLDAWSADAIASVQAQIGDGRIVLDSLPGLGVVSAAFDGQVSDSSC